MAEMVEQKIAESTKKEKKVIKLCPFISGFILEPIKDGLGNQVVGKTTNVSPCMLDKCNFYDSDEKACGIVKAIGYLSLLQDIETEESSGEGTDE